VKREQVAELVRLACKAVTANPRDWSRLETLGAAHYRAGDFKAAAERLEEAVKEKADEGTVWMQLFLAMAYQRLGEADEARQWLARAQAQLRALSSLSPEERLYGRFLEEEARSVLKAPAR
jgi:Flp pilus assembly protein TadD